MGPLKNWISDHFVLCMSACIFICCIIGGWLLYTASRTVNDYNSTARSVEHLEKGIDRAGKRLESAQTEIADAEEHIRRADAVTGKLTERTERNKKALQNANSSLTECQNALTESKASLQILKNQIKALEHKQVVTRRQRDVYALVAAISLGSVIAR